MCLLIALGKCHPGKEEGSQQGGQDGSGSVEDTGPLLQVGSSCLSL